MIRFKLDLIAGNQYILYFNNAIFRAEKLKKLFFRSPNHLAKLYMVKKSRKLRFQSKKKGFWKAQTYEFETL